jgi:aminoglycoside phosphotransferase (APT) family kinase protein
LGKKNLKRTICAWHKQRAKIADTHMSADAALRSEVGNWLHSVNGVCWHVGDLDWRTHSITTVATRAEFSDKKLFIKLPRPDDQHSKTVADQFEAEFRALSMATDVFAPVQAQLGVPRPVGKSERGWFAMEFVEGRRVDQILASNLDSTSKNKVLNQVGLWTRHLHSGFTTEPRTYNFKDYRGRILTWPLNRYPRFIRSAAETLDSQLGNLSGVLFPCSRIHGDLKIDNFLLCNNFQLIGFDLSLAHINPVVFDLAAFLTRLDAWMLSPSGLRIFGAERKNLELAFLRGYGWADPSYENAMSLAWMRLALACATYDDLLTNSLRTRSWLRRWTLALRYEISIRQLTRHLAQW